MLMELLTLYNSRLDRWKIVTRILESLDINFIMLNRPNYRDYLNKTFNTSGTKPLTPKASETELRPPLPSSSSSYILPESIDTSKSMINHLIAKDTKDKSKDKCFLRQTYNAAKPHRMNSAKRFSGSSSFQHLPSKRSQDSPARQFGGSKVSQTSNHAEYSKSSYLQDARKQLQNLKNSSFKTELKLRDYRTNSKQKLFAGSNYDINKSTGAHADLSNSSYKGFGGNPPKAPRKYSNYTAASYLPPTPPQKIPPRTPQNKQKEGTPPLKAYTPIQFRSKLDKSQNDPSDLNERSSQDFNSNTPMQRSSVSHNSSRSQSVDSIKVQDFIMGKKLGEGRFGHVFMVIHKATGAIFALKRVPKATIKQSLLMDQFALQVRIQAAIYHPNIVSLYAVFDDKDHVYLLTEYLASGTLYMQLKKKGKFDQEDAAQRVYNLCRAVQALHLRGVAHRDIKPENIMMNGKQCKLGDFGWATLCDQRRKTYCGTTDYVSPQIIEGKGYGEEVDMWCAGVLTYELLSGKPPFYHLSRQETFKKIGQATPTYPNYFSPEAVDFISKLLKKQQSQRLTSVDALLHPFLKNVARGK